MSLIQNCHRGLYKDAVEWIALNDGPGDDDALIASHVRDMVSVKLVADVFGYKDTTVAKAVVKVRKEHFDG